ncbi:uncharacterized protein LOC130991275 [Salvia miltiorrhiza]|uniref:uncharacterized protein LOC130991275 n=1 Tax=Salvia miltiorrhiza TaxID=226208 RepID=UPI0025ABD71B|nr:uncharacterized protein LOC130991275 [Salvia miltiorrhiza]
MPPPSFQRESSAAAPPSRPLHSENAAASSPQNFRRDPLETSPPSPISLRNDSRDSAGTPPSPPPSPQSDSRGWPTRFVNPFFWGGGFARWRIPCESHANRTRTRSMYVSDTAMYSFSANPCIIEKILSVSVLSQSLSFSLYVCHLGIQSVAAVAPFRACFGSESIARTAAGPAVPEIELVLAGKGAATWRMRWSNVMVEIDRKTTCLGFVDGGSKTEGAAHAAAVLRHC